MGELVTRRAALTSAAAALACGLIRPRDASRPPGAARAAPAPAVPPPPADRFAGPVIDAHVHLVHPRLPGMPDDFPLDDGVRIAPFDGARPADARKRLAAVAEERLKDAGVVAALCMPRSEVSDDDPLGIREVVATAPLVPGVKLHAVGFANPERFDRDHMARVEAELRRGRVKALKVYLGYLAHDPAARSYWPYYRLAAEYLVPVILHTGDPYSPKARLRHAHPLAVDDAAVAFPDTRFVLAHFGNPWVPDAAEVVYKNPNVWADLSAFLVGNADAFAEMERDGLTDRTARRVREWVELAGKPDRFLFGSDWPLAPVKVYRDLVREMLPAKYHAAVFHDNARTLFGV